MLCINICIAYCISSSGQSFSLPDSSILLEAVVVESQKLKMYDAGSQIIKIDSATLKEFEALSLSELLSQATPIFVKTYNPGSLATTSIRGMGAGHTAVLWNGFPIQSPMNGQIDFALLPGSIADQVNIQMGGEGSLWGSSAVGGTVYLENLPEYKSGLQAKINQTFGSFGKHFQGYQLSRGSKNLYTSINFYRDKVKNNFTFKNRAKSGNPEEEMQHAAFSEWGLLLENYWKISKNQQLSLRFWQQNTEREIPSTLTEGNSSATQDDQFTRFLVNWTGHKQKLDWKIQSGFSLEELFYKNEASRIESLSKSKILIQEGELNWYPLNHLSLQGGIQHQYITGSAEDYEQNTHYQQRLAVLGAIKLEVLDNKLESRLNIRQEFTEYGSAPLVPTLGVDFYLWKFLAISGKLSRSYRLPTFNDLYWQPGGNPNLKPESGWAQELSVKADIKIAEIKNQFHLTVFSNRINNWILWQPGSTYWYPQNVKEVWARGIETSFSSSRKWENISIELIARYHYTKSTNEQHQNENDPSIGKQLIYTPIHKGNFNLMFNYGRFGLSWIQQFTGSSYTSSDNISSLKGFTTSNITAHINFKKKYGSLKLRIAANNLFDKDYEIIAWRPMPGRNYQFSLNISPKLNFKHETF